MKESQLSRKQGNALFVTLVLLTLLVGLSATQFSFQQKNLQQSRFYLSRTVLHKYAEAGLALAVHQIRFNLSEFPGYIGTENWDVSMDYGRDGKPGTDDEGEGDGVPTAGEPEVFPYAIGPEHLGIRFSVHVFDTGFSNLRRVVATSNNSEASVTVEKFLQATVVQMPRVGAMYVSPDLALDLNGNAFQMSGEDHDLSGNPTGGEALPGLSTAIGDVEGENGADLLAQVPFDNYDQILGAGGEPAIGEVEPFDLNALVDAFLVSKTMDLAPGQYKDLNTGSLSKDNIPVTYVSGNLGVSGNGGGAGVLIVDGSLKITGEFTFTGLVIVRGDLIVAGGGSRVHVIGSTIVGESMTALDYVGMRFGGTADLGYSSEAMDYVQSVLDRRPKHEGVYYDENRKSRNSTGGGSDAGGATNG